MVEFSADAWQGSAPGLQQGLAERMDAVDKLTQGLHALAESGNITGEGADGMRAYIREVHVPVLQCLLLGLSTFQTAVGVYWAGYRQVDADGNFHLVRDEHETHVFQLDAGMRQLRGIGSQLRQISADASRLVSLGSAGAGAVERTVDDLQRMHLIAKTQLETWEAYEGSDPGFAQVQELISRLGGIVNRVGSVDVGRGRSYLPGSFQAELVPLGELVEGMSQYCQDNQQRATEGWLDMFDKYAQDVEAARREQALTDLIWDGLQILAGAVVTVIGLGLTPFTAGFSLSLTAAGGMLLVGGINNAINHVSIATTGNDFNLVGMAADAIGQWYDVNVVQPRAASGNWDSQFWAGVGAGVGGVVRAAAEFSVKDTHDGLLDLIYDRNDARNALWNQLTTTLGQVAAGNPFVIGEISGEIAGALLPGAVAAKAARPLAKAAKLPGRVKPPIITDPRKATSALDPARTVDEAASLFIPGPAAAKLSRGGDQLTKAGSAEALIGLTRAQQALTDQLLAAGVKIDVTKVLDIWEAPGDRVVWYDEGRATAANRGGAGLAHVLEHADDFAKKGIAKHEIAALVKKAIQENKVVGHQGSGTGRPVYRVELDGRIVDIAITVSKNGYIVGANPTSKFGN
ncbi:hypothetical protein ASF88_03745 [Leifsonia sp. Leaf336]|uniref:T7SS effector LXG polymorphic toxin n=1 Tax=Leifsonia sp. Leaf336 TaxID=1736341 RepID=UPI0006FA233A|nr:T7SS effector LXG polymorphic toxin [Leifsonia sp. Leaf336]KQR53964.1 hypothetical protein ASF88_03745 [Leifsonia sp. Leaf336]